MLRRLVLDVKRQFMKIFCHRPGRDEPMVARCSKTAALERHASDVFGEKKFNEFVIGVGIVGTHLEYNRPTIFKNTVNQSYSSTASFLPGFGCTIAEAVISSCAAYPVFKKKLGSDGESR